MPRLALGCAGALAAALVLAAPAPALVPAAPAAAQRSVAMKATAPEKMSPPGESAAMRDCDKQAMRQHVKMEDRARFVKDCVASKMK